MRTRVLFVNEFSCHNSGYAKYGMEVLKRLSQKPDIQIAELACYASGSSKNDAMKASQLPWDVYFNTPDMRNQELVKLYDAKPSHEFGEFQFNDVCIDFKPHIVMDIRDWWMQQFQETSPFRNRYNWAIMTTVDATPQHRQWIYTFCNADAVFTYTDWGAEVLREHAGNHINLLGSASPCAEQWYVPRRNNEAKEEFGMMPDIKVIGTVMRNQGRKLYPDLFSSFREFLDKSKRTDIYLYCHTAYPDSGWDIPELLKQYKIASRVLFTYKCQNCKYFYPSFYVGVNTVCPKCGEPKAKLPRVENGVSDQELVKIMQTFDLYVQYANCLTPNQDIFTDIGWIDISKIKIGQHVWTHDRQWKEVTDTFKHDIQQDVLKISVCGDNECLEVTREHPLFVLDDEEYIQSKSKSSFREWIGRRLKSGNRLPNKKFIEAEKLSEGDMIAFTIDYTVEQYDTIDLSSFMTDNYIIRDNTYRYKSSTVSHPLTINIDEELLKWIGLYVADGASDKRGRVCVTSNELNKDNVALCQENMCKFGNVHTRHNPDTHSYDVMISNKIFASYLLKECSKHEHKKFPDWTSHIAINKQKVLLEGLFMGDGHYIADRDVSIYCTISENMSNQIKHMLKRIGIVYNVRKVIKNGNRRPQYRFEVPGNISQGDFRTVRNNSRSLNHDGYYLYQVKNIESKSYNGPVYNIEVKDSNSYTTKIGCVHNCEGMGMPLVEAAAIGIPVVGIDYSGMTDVLEKLEGDRLQPLHLATEVHSGRLRAVPNNAAFVQYLLDFFSLPLPNRLIKGKTVHDNAKSKYNWDETAEKWYQYFKTVDINKYEFMWKQPIQIRRPEPLTPDKMELPVGVFCEWLISNVLCDPSKLYGYLHMRMIRDITNGIVLTDGQMTNYENEYSLGDKKAKIMTFNREMAYNYMRNIANEYNAWENKRCLKK